MQTDLTKINTRVRCLLMSESSDRLGLFSELICGRCRIYGNKERYECNNTKLFLLCLGLSWECEGIMF